MGQFRGEGPGGFEDVLARINREEQRTSGGTLPQNRTLPFDSGFGDPNDPARVLQRGINEAMERLANSLFKDLEGRELSTAMNNFMREMVQEHAAGGPPITGAAIDSRGALKVKEGQKAAGNRKVLEDIANPPNPTLPPTPASTPSAAQVKNAQRRKEAIEERFRINVNTTPQEIEQLFEQRDALFDDPGSGFGGGSADDTLAAFTGGGPLSADDTVAAATVLGDVQTTEGLEDAGGGFDSSQAGFGGFDEDDFFRHGGVFDDNTAIVGENGEELIIAAPGTRVISLGGGKKAKSAADRLRKAGIRSMQDGGVVEPLLPFGVRRALAGGTIDPTRRRLSRAAGLPVLSAQARQNLLPEELEVFNRLSREAGIPEGAFAQEQESAFPGANLARGRARFAPRVLR